MAPKDGCHRLWPVSVPLLLGLLSAWPVLGHRFSNDDDILIVNNPLVHDLSHLRENLAHDYFHSSSSRPIGYYRPVTKIAFMLEYRAFAAGPRGYHLVSLALFLTSVLLFWLLLIQLRVPAAAATAAASIYASHPAQAESVAIVASQSDLLCAVFLLAGLSTYVRYRVSGRAHWLVAALLAGALALGSKESAIILPLLACFWELAQVELRPAELKKRLHFLWLLLPLLAYAALRVALGVLPISGSMNADWAQAVASTAKQVVAMLLRCLVPNLWSPYLHQTRPTGSPGEVLLWLTPVVLALAVSVWVFWKLPDLRWGIVLLLLPLLPALPGSMVHTTSDPRLLVVSDRWVWPCAMGAAVLWSAALAQVRVAGPRWGRVLFPLLCSVLVLLQLLDARLENASFHDESSRKLFVGLALAERGARSPVEEENVLAARALLADRRRDRATSVSLYGELSRRAPSDYNKRFNFAVALTEAGDLRRAAREAWTVFHARTPEGRALPENDSYFRNRPDRAYLLGWILERLGQAGPAAAYYQQSLALNPAHAEARRRLALLARTR